MTATIAETAVAPTAAEIAREAVEAGRKTRYVPTCDLKAGDVILHIGHYQTVESTDIEDGWGYVNFKGMSVRGDFSSYDYHEVMN
jgi:hypothetical protein